MSFKPAFNYVWFREIQMQKRHVFFCFWASTSICQSVALTIPPLPPKKTPTTTNNTNSPTETRFPSCWFRWMHFNVRSQMHQQLGPVSVCHLEPEYHECMCSLYRDTNHLAPSVNLIHGEKWKKTEQEFNFIWNVFQMWTAGFPFPFETTWSCRIITSACVLTCMGTCTHILVHWGNSFKAIEYLTPHFSVNPSLCQVLQIRNRSKVKVLLHLFICITSMTEA